jgi:hypothetical protein
MTDSSWFGVIATILVCFFLFNISSSLEKISLSLQGFDLSAESEKENRIKTERRNALVDWLRSK